MDSKTRAIILQEHLRTAHRYAYEFLRDADDLHTVRMSNHAIAMLSDMFMALDSLRLDAEELVNITHYGR